MRNTQIYTKEFKEESFEYQWDKNVQQTYTKYHKRTKNRNNQKETAGDI